MSSVVVAVERLESKTCGGECTGSVGGAGAETIGDIGCLTSSGIGKERNERAAALTRVAAVLLLQLVVQLELVSTESELRGDDN